MLLRSLVASSFAVSVPFVVAAEAGTVRVVQNGTSQQLVAAVQASVAGDTVLVQGGTYAGLSIDRGIRVVADPEGSANLGGIRVENLPAGDVCAVSGFVLSNPVSHYVEVTNCAGSVRFEGLFELPSDSGFVGGCGAFVRNSPDVAFLRCTLRGNSELTFPPNTLSGAPLPNGLDCGQSSRVALFQCPSAGGAGHRSFFNTLGAVNAHAGGGGVEVDATSALFARECGLSGSEGGAGADFVCAFLFCGLPPTPGAVGGVGVTARTGADVTLVECGIASGLGGNGGHGGGPCCPGGPVFQDAASAPPGAATAGAITQLSPFRAQLATPTHVRAGQTLDLTVTGSPGDEVYLAVSLGTQWLASPPLAGVQLFRSPARRQFLGTLSSFGATPVSLPVTGGPAAGQAQLRHLQLVTRAPGGPFRLGGAATVLMLGAGL